MRKFPKAASYDEVEDEASLPPFQVFERSLAITQHDIYLSSPVQSPAHYDELCMLLRNASEHDEITLYLNTPGGELASGLAIIQAMRDSEATVTAVLHPQAHSAGALLFLAADEWVAPKNSIMMLHMYTSGLFGKGSEQASEVAASVRWYEQVMQDICVPFLTPQEVHDIIDGKDLWLQDSAINERLDRVRASREKTALRVA